MGFQSNNKRKIEDYKSRIEYRYYLPVELWLKIFGYCRLTNSFTHFELVCKQWKMLACESTQHLSVNFSEPLRDIDPRSITDLSVAINNRSNLTRLGFQLPHLTQSDQIEEVLTCLKASTNIQNLVINLREAHGLFHQIDNKWDFSTFTHLRGLKFVSVRVCKKLPHSLYTLLIDSVEYIPTSKLTRFDNIW